MDFVLIPQLLKFNLYSSYNFDIQDANSRHLPHHRLGLSIKVGM